MAAEAVLPESTFEKRIEEESKLRCEKSDSTFSDLRSSEFEEISVKLETLQAEDGHDPSQTINPETSEISTKKEHLLADTDKSKNFVEIAENIQEKNENLRDGSFTKSPPIIEVSLEKICEPSEENREKMEKAAQLQKDKMSKFVEENFEIIRKHPQVVEETCVAYDGVGIKERTILAEKGNSEDEAQMQKDQIDEPVEEKPEVIIKASPSEDEIYKFSDGDEIRVKQIQIDKENLEKETWLQNDQTDEPAQEKDVIIKVSPLAEKSHGSCGAGETTEKENLIDNERLEKEIQMQENQIGKTLEESFQRINATDEGLDMEGEKVKENQNQIENFNEFSVAVELEENSKIIPEGPSHEPIDMIRNTGEKPLRKEALITNKLENIFPADEGLEKGIEFESEEQEIFEEKEKLEREILAGEEPAAPTGDEPSLLQGSIEVSTQNNEADSENTENSSGSVFEKEVLEASGKEKSTEKEEMTETTENRNLDKDYGAVAGGQFLTQETQERNFEQLQNLEYSYPLQSLIGESSKKDEVEGEEVKELQNLVSEEKNLGTINSIENTEMVVCKDQEAATGLVFMEQNLETIDAKEIESEAAEERDPYIQNEEIQSETFGEVTEKNSGLESMERSIKTIDAKDKVENEYPEQNPHEDFSDSSISVVTVEQNIQINDIKSKKLEEKEKPSSSVSVEQNLETINAVEKENANQEENPDTFFADSSISEIIEGSNIQIDGIQSKKFGEETEEAYGLISMVPNPKTINVKEELVKENPDIDLADSFISPIIDDRRSQIGEIQPEKHEEEIEETSGVVSGEQNLKTIDARDMENEDPAEKPNKNVGDSSISTATEDIFEKINILQSVEQNLETSDPQETDDVKKELTSSGLVSGEKKLQTINAKEEINNGSSEERPHKKFDDKSISAITVETNIHDDERSVELGDELDETTDLASMEQNLEKTNAREETENENLEETPDETLGGFSSSTITADQTIEGDELEFKTLKEICESEEQKAFGLVSELRETKQNEKECTESSKEENTNENIDAYSVSESAVQRNTMEEFELLSREKHHEADDIREIADTEILKEYNRHEETDSVLLTQVASETSLQRDKLEVPRHDSVSESECEKPEVVSEMVSEDQSNCKIGESDSADESANESANDEKYKGKIEDVSVMEIQIEEGLRKDDVEAEKESQKLEGVTDSVVDDQNIESNTESGTNIAEIPVETQSEQNLEPSELVSEEFGIGIIDSEEKVGNELLNTHDSSPDTFSSTEPVEETCSQKEDTESNKVQNVCETVSVGMESSNKEDMESLNIEPVTEAQEEHPESSTVAETTKEASLKNGRNILEEDTEKTEKFESGVSEKDHELDASVKTSGTITATEDKEGATPKEDVISDIGLQKEETESDKLKNASGLGLDRDIEDTDKNLSAVFVGKEMIKESLQKVEDESEKTEELRSGLVFEGFDKSECENVEKVAEGESIKQSYGELDEMESTNGEKTINENLDAMSAMEVLVEESLRKEKVVDKESQKFERVTDPALDDQNIESNTETETQRNISEEIKSKEQLENSSVIVSVEDNCKYEGIKNARNVTSNEEEPTEDPEAIPVTQAQIEETLEKDKVEEASGIVQLERLINPISNDQGVETMIGTETKITEGPNNEIGNGIDTEEKPRTSLQEEKTENEKTGQPAKLEITKEGNPTLAIGSNTEEREQKGLQKDEEELMDCEQDQAQKEHLDSSIVAETGEGTYLQKEEIESLQRENGVETEELKREVLEKDDEPHSGEKITKTGFATENREVKNPKEEEISEKDFQKEETGIEEVGIASNLVSEEEIGGVNKNHPSYATDGMQKEENENEKNEEVESELDSKEQIIETFDINKEEEKKLKDEQQVSVDDTEQQGEEEKFKEEKACTSIAEGIKEGEKLENAFDSVYEEEKHDQNYVSGEETKQSCKEEKLEEETIDSSLTQETTETGKHEKAFVSISDEQINEATDVLGGKIKQQGEEEREEEMAEVSEEETGHHSEEEKLAGKKEETSVADARMEIGKLEEAAGSVFDNWSNGNSQETAVQRNAVEEFELVSKEKLSEADDTKKNTDTETPKEGQDEETDSLLLTQVASEATLQKAESEVPQHDSVSEIETEKLEVVSKLVSEDQSYCRIEESGRVDKESPNGEKHKENLETVSITGIQIEESLRKDEIEVDEESQKLEGVTDSVLDQNHETNTETDNNRAETLEENQLGQKLEASDLMSDDCGHGITDSDEKVDDQSINTHDSSPYTSVTEQIQDTCSQEEEREKKKVENITEIVSVGTESSNEEDKNLDIEPISEIVSVGTESSNEEDKNLDIEPVICLQEKETESEKPEKALESEIKDEKNPCGEAREGMSVVESINLDKEQIQEEHPDSSNVAEKTEETCLHKEVESFGGNKEVTEILESGIPEKDHELASAEKISEKVIATDERVETPNDEEISDVGLQKEETESGKPESASGSVFKRETKGIDKNISTVSVEEEMIKESLQKVEEESEKIEEVRSGFVSESDDKPECENVEKEAKVESTEKTYGKLDETESTKGEETTSTSIAEDRIESEKFDNISDSVSKEQNHEENDVSVEKIEQHGKEEENLLEEITGASAAEERTESAQLDEASSSVPDEESHRITDVPDEIKQTCEEEEKLEEKTDRSVAEETAESGKLEKAFVSISDEQSHEIIDVPGGEIEQDEEEEKHEEEITKVSEEEIKQHHEEEKLAGKNTEMSVAEERMENGKLEEISGSVSDEQSHENVDVSVEQTKQLGEKEEKHEEETIETSVAEELIEHEKLKKASGSISDDENPGGNYVPMEEIKQCDWEEETSVAEERIESGKLEKAFGSISEEQSHKKINVPVEEIKLQGEEEEKHENETTEISIPEVLKENEELVRASYDERSHEKNNLNEEIEQCGEEEKLEQEKTEIGVGDGKTESGKLEEVASSVFDNQSNENIQGNEIKSKMPEKDSESEEQKAFELVSELRETDQNEIEDTESSKEEKIDENIDAYSVSETVVQRNTVEEFKLVPKEKPSEAEEIREIADTETPKEENLHDDTDSLLSPQVASESLLQEDISEAPQHDLEKQVSVEQTKQLHEKEEKHEEETIETSVAEELIEHEKASGSISDDQNPGGNYVPMEEIKQCDRKEETSVAEERIESGKLEKAFGSISEEQSHKKINVPVEEIKLQGEEEEKHKDETIEISVPEVLKENEELVRASYDERSHEKNNLNEEIEQCGEEEKLEQEKTEIGVGDEKMESGKLEEVASSVSDNQSNENIQGNEIKSKMPEKDSESEEQKAFELVSELRETDQNEIEDTESSKEEKIDENIDAYSVSETEVQRNTVEEFKLVPKEKPSEAEEIRVITDTETPKEENLHDDTDSLLSTPVASESLLQEDISEGPQHDLEKQVSVEQTKQLHEKEEKHEEETIETSVAEELIEHEKLEKASGSISDDQNPGGNYVPMEEIKQCDREEETSVAEERIESGKLEKAFVSISEEQSHKKINVPVEEIKLRGEEEEKHKDETTEISVPEVLKENEELVRASYDEQSHEKNNLNEEIEQCGEEEKLEQEKTEIGVGDEKTESGKLEEVPSSVFDNQSNENIQGNEIKSKMPEKDSESEEQKAFELVSELRETDQNEKEYTESSKEEKIDENIDAYSVSETVVQRNTVEEFKSVPKEKPSEAEEIREIADTETPKEENLHDDIDSLLSTQVASESLLQEDISEAPQHDPVPGAESEKLDAVPEMVSKWQSSGKNQESCSVEVSTNDEKEKENLEAVSAMEIQGGESLRKDGVEAEKESQKLEGDTDTSLDDQNVETNREIDIDRDEILQVFHPEQELKASEPVSKERGIEIIDSDEKEENEFLKAHVSSLDTSSVTERVEETSSQKEETESKKDANVSEIISLGTDNSNEEDKGENLDIEPVTKAQEHPESSIVAETAEDACMRKEIERLDGDKEETENLESGIPKKDHELDPEEKTSQTVIATEDREVETPKEDKISSIGLQNEETESEKLERANGPVFEREIIGISKNLNAISAREDMIKESLQKGEEESMKIEEAGSGLVFESYDKPECENVEKVSEVEPTKKSYSKLDDTESTNGENPKKENLDVVSIEVQTEESLLQDEVEGKGPQKLERDAGPALEDQNIETNTGTEIEIREIPEEFQSREQLENASEIVSVEDSRKYEGIEDVGKVNSNKEPPAADPETVPVTQAQIKENLEQEQVEEMDSVHFERSIDAVYNDQGVTMTETETKITEGPSNEIDNEVDTKETPRTSLQEVTETEKSERQIGLEITEVGNPILGVGPDTEEREQKGLQKDEESTEHKQDQTQQKHPDSSIFADKGEEISLQRDESEGLQKDTGVETQELEPEVLEKDIEWGSGEKISETVFSTENKEVETPKEDEMSEISLKKEETESEMVGTEIEIREIPEEFQSREQLENASEIVSAEDSCKYEGIEDVGKVSSNEEPPAGDPETVPVTQAQIKENLEQEQVEEMDSVHLERSIDAVYNDQGVESVTETENKITEGPSNEIDNEVATKETSRTSLQEEVTETEKSERQIGLELTEEENPILGVGPDTEEREQKGLQKDEESTEHKQDQTQHEHPDSSIVADKGEEISLQRDESEVLQKDNGVETQELEPEVLEKDIEWDSGEKISETVFSTENKEVETPKEDEISEISLQKEETESEMVGIDSDLVSEEEIEVVNKNLSSIATDELQKGEKESSKNEEMESELVSKGQIFESFEENKEIKLNDEENKNKSLDALAVQQVIVEEREHLGEEDKFEEETQGASIAEEEIESEMLENASDSVSNEQNHHENDVPEEKFEQHGEEDNPVEETIETSIAEEKTESGKLDNEIGLAPDDQDHGNNNVSMEEIKQHGEAAENLEEETIKASDAEEKTERVKLEKGYGTISDEQSHKTIDVPVEKFIVQGEEEEKHEEETAETSAAKELTGDEKLEKTSHSVYDKESHEINDVFEEATKQSTEAEKVEEDKTETTAAEERMETERLEEASASNFDTQSHEDTNVPVEEIKPHGQEEDERHEKETIETSVVEESTENDKLETDSASVSDKQKNGEYYVSVEEIKRHDEEEEKIEKEMTELIVEEERTESGKLNEAFGSISYKQSHEKINVPLEEIIPKDEEEMHEEETIEMSQKELTENKKVPVAENEQQHEEEEKYKEETTEVPEEEIKQHDEEEKLSKETTKTSVAEERTEIGKLQEASGLFFYKSHENIDVPKEEIKQWDEEERHEEETTEKSIVEALPENSKLENDSSLVSDEQKHGQNDVYVEEIKQCDHKEEKLEEETTKTSVAEERKESGKLNIAPHSIPDEQRPENIDAPVEEVGLQLEEEENHGKIEKASDQISNEQNHERIDVSMEEIEQQGEEEEKNREEATEISVAEELTEKEKLEKASGSISDEQCYEKNDLSEEEIKITGQEEKTVTSVRDERTESEKLEETASSVSNNQSNENINVPVGKIRQQVEEEKHEEITEALEEVTEPEKLEKYSGSVSQEQNYGNVHEEEIKQHSQEEKLEEEISEVFEEATKQCSEAEKVEEDKTETTVVEERIASERLDEASGSSFDNQSHEETNVTVEEIKRHGQEEEERHEKETTETSVVEESAENSKLETDSASVSDKQNHGEYHVSVEEIKKHDEEEKKLEKEMTELSVEEERTESGKLNEAFGSISNKQSPEKINVPLEEIVPKGEEEMHEEETRETSEKEITENKKVPVEENEQQGEEEKHEKETTEVPGEEIKQHGEEEKLSKEKTKTSVAEERTEIGKLQEASGPFFYNSHENIDAPMEEIKQWDGEETHEEETTEKSIVEELPENPKLEKDSSLVSDEQNHGQNYVYVEEIKQCDHREEKLEEETTETSVAEERKESGKLNIASRSIPDEQTHKKFDAPVEEGLQLEEEENHGKIEKASGQISNEQNRERINVPMEEIEQQGEEEEKNREEATEISVVEELTEKEKLEKASGSISDEQCYMKNDLSEEEIKITGQEEKLDEEKIVTTVRDKRTESEKLEETVGSVSDNQSNENIDAPMEEIKQWDGEETTEKSIVKELPENPKLEKDSSLVSDEQNHGQNDVYVEEIKQCDHREEKLEEETTETSVAEERKESGKLDIASRSIPDEQTHKKIDAPVEEVGLQLEEVENHGKIEKASGQISNEQNRERINVPMEEIEQQGEEEEKNREEATKISVVEELTEKKKLEKASGSISDEQCYMKNDLSEEEIKITGQEEKLDEEKTVTTVRDKRTESEKLEETVGSVSDNQSNENIDAPMEEIKQWDGEETHSEETTEKSIVEELPENPKLEKDSSLVSDEQNHGQNDMYVEEIKQCDHREEKLEEETTETSVAEERKESEKLDIASHSIPNEQTHEKIDAPVEEVGLQLEEEENHGKIEKASGQISNEQNREIINVPMEEIEQRGEEEEKNKEEATEISVVEELTEKEKLEKASGSISDEQCYMKNDLSEEEIKIIDQEEKLDEEKTVTTVRDKRTESEKLEETVGSVSDNQSNENIDVPMEEIKQWDEEEKHEEETTEKSTVEELPESPKLEKDSSLVSDEQNHGQNDVYVEGIKQCDHKEEKLEEETTKTSVAKERKESGKLDIASRSILDEQTHEKIDVPVEEVGLQLEEEENNGKIEKASGQVSNEQNRERIDVSMEEIEQQGEEEENNREEATEISVAEESTEKEKLEKASDEQRYTKNDVPAGKIRQQVEEEITEASALEEVTEPEKLEKYSGSVSHEQNYGNLHEEEIKQHSQEEKLEEETSKLLPVEKIEVQGKDKEEHEEETTDKNVAEELTEDENLEKPIGLVSDEQSHEKSDLSEDEIKQCYEEEKTETSVAEERTESGTLQKASGSVSDKRSHINTIVSVENIKQLGEEEKHEEKSPETPFGEVSVEEIKQRGLEEKLEEKTKEASVAEESKESAKLEEAFGSISDDNHVTIDVLMDAIEPRNEEEKHEEEAIKLSEKEIEQCGEEEKLEKEETDTGVPEERTESGKLEEASGPVSDNQSHENIDLPIEEIKQHKEESTEMHVGEEIIEIEKLDKDSSSVSDEQNHGDMSVEEIKQRGPEEKLEEETAEMSVAEERKESGKLEEASGSIPDEHIHGKVDGAANEITTLKDEHSSTTNLFYAREEETLQVLDGEIKQRDETEATKTDVAEERTESKKLEEASHSVSNERSHEKINVPVQQIEQLEEEEEKHEEEKMETRAAEEITESGNLKKAFESVSDEQSHEKIEVSAEETKHHGEEDLQEERIGTSVEGKIMEIEKPEKASSVSDEHSHEKTDANLSNPIETVEDGEKEIESLDALSVKKISMEALEQRGGEKLEEEMEETSSTKERKYGDTLEQASCGLSDEYSHEKIDASLSKEIANLKDEEDTDNSLDQLAITETLQKEENEMLQKSSDLELEEQIDENFGQHKENSDPNFHGFSATEINVEEITQKEGKKLEEVSGFVSEERFPQTQETTQTDNWEKEFDVEKHESGFDVVFVEKNQENENSEILEPKIDENTPKNLNVASGSGDLDEEVSEEGTEKLREAFNLESEEQIKKFGNKTIEPDVVKDEHPRSEVFMPVMPEEIKEEQEKEINKKPEEIYANENMENENMEYKGGPRRKIDDLSVPSGLVEEISEIIETTESTKPEKDSDSVIGETRPASDMVETAPPKDDQIMECSKVENGWTLVSEKQWGKKIEENETREIAIVKDEENQEKKIDSSSFSAIPVEEILQKERERQGEVSGLAFQEQTKHKADPQIKDEKIENESNAIFKDQKIENESDAIFKEQNVEITDPIEKTERDIIIEEENQDTITKKLVGTDNTEEELIEEIKASDSEKVRLFDLLQRSRKQTLQIAEKSMEEKNPEVGEEELKNKQQEEGDKTDEEQKDEDQHKIDDSSSEAPVMVETSRDVEPKPAHKKSHNILSSVGSKVKHSIGKVKKAIIGKSSHTHSGSPK